MTLNGTQKLSEMYSGWNETEDLLIKIWTIEDFKQQTLDVKKTIQFDSKMDYKKDYMKP